MVMFSEEAKSLHASDIREILKVTENPEIISFAGGLPAPELFPIDEMMKVDVEILKKEGRQAVQYSTTEGYIPLRKQIAARMKSSFHTDCTYEDIIITAGSQQGLSLLGQLFLNEGDVVLVESPLRRLLLSISRSSSKSKRMIKAWCRKPWKRPLKSTVTASA